MKNLKQISLFSGAGGFDLAGERAGFETVAQVEIDDYCTSILEKNFPNAKRYSDIREFDGLPYRGTIDVISAGFPCQPFSVAGNRDGESDNRFLWPETIRVVREVRPRFILLENVPGLLSILEQDVCPVVEGQAYCLFSEGDTAHIARRVIGRILDDIEKAGYTCPRHADGTPIIFVVPACAVEAIHQRDRVWIVAHRNDLILDGSGKARGRRAEHPDGHPRNDPHADGQRQQQPGGTVGEKRRRSEYCDQGHDTHAAGFGLQECEPSALTPESGLNSGLSAPAYPHAERFGWQRRRLWAEPQPGETSQHPNGIRKHFGAVEWQPNDTAEVIRVAYGIPGGLDEN
jgi:DNA-cytosine methyltransferase